MFHVGLRGYKATKGGFPLSRANARKFYARK